MSSYTLPLRFQILKQIITHSLGLAFQELCNQSLRLNSQPFRLTSVPFGS
ncbi:hypothetical protein QUB80_06045 [Chlorogloeopsis sp. ULAP01]|nr:hypothetical protein [Chlorogloeopsis sp. ULAP01]